MLEKDCLIPFGIMQLTIHPSGGTFILGSGDATLIVEEGTVQVETDVRYAVILHGPFILHSAGFKLASVVVYLNLEGAILLKPVTLILRHWCKEIDDEADLSLVRSPHITCDIPECYVFDEVAGTISPSESFFSISVPECLYCVEMKVDLRARYNATVFLKNLPDSIKFRIQLMCDSLEWNTVGHNVNQMM